MSKTRKVLIIIIFLLGLAILSYPFINNYINNKTQTQVINEYEKTLEEMDQEQIDSMKKAAEEYNNRLSGNGNKNTTTESSGKSYADLLNVGETIGYISIPKVNIKLPIYHGTSETVLQKGIGHLETSSLPIGGESTHAVLTGHNGLPTAKLFTDLDQLEKGDSFYLEVLGDKLKYKIDQIIVVLPEDTDELQIIDGKDYVTLITCTPYMVNSHRLLVRGIRVENDDIVIETPKDEVDINTGITIESNTNQRIIIYLYLFVIILDLIIIIIIIRHKKKRKDVIFITEEKPKVVENLILDDVIEIRKPTYEIDINDFITDTMCYTLYALHKTIEISPIDEEILETTIEEIIPLAVETKTNETISNVEETVDIIIPIIVEKEDKISIEVDGPYLRKIEEPKTYKQPKVHERYKNPKKKNKKNKSFVNSLITGVIIISEIIKQRRDK